MRTLTHFCCAAALLSLAGCAAAMPGYVPDKGRLQLAKDKAAKSEPQVATPPPADGSYVPNAKEKSFSCRRLNGVIQIKIQQYRAEASRQPTSTITRASETAMAKPMAGGNVKPDSASEHARDRARLVAHSRKALRHLNGVSRILGLQIQGLREFVVRFRVTLEA